MFCADGVPDMTTKVMVSFPDEFLAEVDRVATEEHRSRSELLREAMRLYIRVRQGVVPLGTTLACGRRLPSRMHWRGLRLAPRRTA